MSRHRRLRQKKLRSPQRLARLWRNRASRRLRRQIGALLKVVIIAAFALSLTLSVAGAATQPQTCPAAAVHCVITPPKGVGELDVAAAGRYPGVPWAASDPGGAFMAFVNIDELASVGDGGKDPGGMSCSTFRFAANVACLMPEGTLILQSTGPGGPTGSPQVLTAGLIGLLRGMQAAGITRRDLRFFAAWVHAREARR